MKLTDINVSKFTQYKLANKMQFKNIISNFLVKNLTSRAKSSANLFRKSVAVTAPSTNLWWECACKKFPLPITPIFLWICFGSKQQRTVNSPKSHRRKLERWFETEIENRVLATANTDHFNEFRLSPKILAIDFTVRSARSIAGRTRRYSKRMRSPSGTTPAA